MRSCVQHPRFGQIVYEEGLWSGKKNVLFDGKPLKQIGKKAFVHIDGEEQMNVTVQGNMLMGVTIQTKGEQIQVVPKPAWYEWVMAFLPFALIMAWGNNVALCSIIPVVGGAIGGGIGGIGMVTAMYLFRGKSLGGKLLAGLLNLLATFGVAALVGFLIVLATAA